jgi:hypothetical protein
MTPRRPTTLLIACALFASVAAGCGTKGEDHDPVREGIATDLGGLDYNVFITRQLNPKDVGDRDYYNGPEESEECSPREAGGEAETPPTLTPEERPQRCPTNLFGVFMQICNETTDGTPTPAREPSISRDGREFAGDFEIEDAQGNKFEPIPLPETNVFAYRARPLKKDDCIPATGSAASESPTAGALLVFRIPVAATENRPLELSISVGGETRKFELDI